jgi:hypothetical protein
MSQNGSVFSRDGLEIRAGDMKRVIAGWAFVAATVGLATVRGQVNERVPTLDDVKRAKPGET